MHIEWNLKASNWNASDTRNLYRNCFAVVTMYVWFKFSRLTCFLQVFSVKYQVTARENMQ